jgi:hypothetical protein
VFPGENDIIMGLMRAVGLSTCDFRLIKMVNDRGIVGVCRTTIGRRILQKRWILKGVDKLQIWVENENWV